MIEFSDLHELKKNEIAENLMVHILNLLIQKNRQMINKRINYHEMNFKWRIIIYFFFSGNLRSLEYKRKY